MKITEKSDVYSYGVVLLEILCGRRAVESQVAGDGVHIVEWVKRKMGSLEPAVSVLDPSLRGLPDNVVQEMLQALGIAMFCVNWTPQERPTMKGGCCFAHGGQDQIHHHGKKSSCQPLIKQQQQPSSQHQTG